MQTNEIALELKERFTRTDYVALRYWLTKVPLAWIADRCYPSDAFEPEDATLEVRARLTQLRDWLCDKLIHTNPHLQETLATAREKGVWSKQLQDLLFEQEQRGSNPLASDGLAAWFRPPVVRSLQAEGMQTLGDLHQWILKHRHTWFYRLPRLGPGRANAVVRWLQTNANWAADVAQAVLPPPQERHLVALVKDGPIVPLERMIAPARRTGLNATALPPLVYAPDDVAAVKTYLLSFQDVPATYRAYKKELERYVAWALIEQGKSLRDVLIEDCEAYKQFLLAVPPRWTRQPGQAVPRSHPDWRPFQGQLAVTSVCYAIKAVKKFHDWGVKVRYFGGDPWATVKEPRTAKGLPPVQVGRALPEDTWLRLCDAFERYADPAQDARTERGPWLRAAHVALLLGGACGLRREEIAEARVCDVPWEQYRPEGQLDVAVLGKGLKWRFAILTNATIRAIHAHWADWEIPPTPADAAGARKDCPRLLSPMDLGRFQVVQAKHKGVRGAGYSPSGIYHLLKGSFAWIMAQEDSGLTPEDCTALSRASTHALRHTFGSTSATQNAPIKQIQMLLGHASLQTTTLYTNLERDTLHAGVREVEHKLQARRKALIMKNPTT